MKLVRSLEAIFDKIISALAVFAGVLLTLAMLIVCLDVIMRYFLNQPIAWVQEMIEYALLCLTFTGAAWLLKEEGHVKVDILINRISLEKRNILDVIVQILGIFLCTVLTYYGVQVAWDHFARGVYNPTLLEFPKGPLLAIIPIGTFLLLIQFIRKLVTSLKDLIVRYQ